MSTNKYRPTLTAEQIKKILTLAKTETPELSEASISIITTLAPFLTKIENAGLVPAYTIKEAPRSVPGLHLSKEEQWELCYTKQLEQPENCTLQDIEGAKEHKYLHGLMSKEEQELFEVGDL